MKNSKFKQESGISLIELMITLAVIGIAMFIGIRFYENIQNKEILNNLAIQDAERINTFTNALNAFVVEAENNGSSTANYPNLSTLGSPITVNELISNNNLPSTFAPFNTSNGTTVYGYTKLGQQIFGFVNINYGFPTSIGAFTTGSYPNLAGRYGISDYQDYNAYELKVAADSNKLSSSNEDDYKTGIVGISLGTQQNLQLVNASSLSTESDSNLYNFFLSPVNLQENHQQRMNAAEFISLKENPGYLLLLVQGFSGGDGTPTSTNGSVANWSVYNYGYSSFCPGNNNETPSSGNQDGVNAAVNAGAIAPNSNISQHIKPSGGVNTLSIGNDTNSGSSPFPNSTETYVNSPSWVFNSLFLNTYACIPATPTIVNEMQTKSCTQDPNNCLIYSTNTPLSINEFSGTDSLGNSYLFYGSQANGGNCSQNGSPTPCSENGANAYLYLNMQLGSEYYNLSGWAGLATVVGTDADSGYNPDWRTVELDVFLGSGPNNVSFYIDNWPFSWTQNPDNISNDQYFLNGNKAVTSLVNPAYINLLGSGA